MKLLLNKKADVNWSNGNDGSTTPLLYAVKNGHTEIVKLLLDVVLNTQQNDSHGRTPLMYAAEKDYIEIVKLLLDGK